MISKSFLGLVLAFCASCSSIVYLEDFKLEFEAKEYEKFDKNDIIGSKFLLLEGEWQITNIRLRSDKFYIYVSGRRFKSSNNANSEVKQFIKANYLDKRN
jgi:hypothetical protein